MGLTQNEKKRIALAFAIGFAGVVASIWMLASSNIFNAAVNVVVVSMSSPMVKPASYELVFNYEGVDQFYKQPQMS